MGRLKTARRASWLPRKQDTPMKTTLSRRDSKFRRLLLINHYETLPEELTAEGTPVRPTNAVLPSIKPVHFNPALRLSRPACTENHSGNAGSSTDRKPAHRVSPAVQMTSDAEACKQGEVQVKEDEEQQNSALTPDSVTFSSTESDATFSSDDEDEDEEECYSSATLSSPEIFRKENYVENSATHGGFMSLHHHIKNSTLLDVSHAESFHLHHPPNLSTIIDVSTVVAENNREISQHRGLEAEIKMYTDILNSDEALKVTTSPKLTNRRPIVYRKKKVWFKSPMVTDTFEGKHIPATKSSIRCASEPVQTSSPAEHMKPDSDTSKTDGANSTERPILENQEKATFFDFIDDSDRDAFFQGMRERCVKLRSAPLFPLTALEHSVM